MATRNGDGRISVQFSWGHVPVAHNLHNVARVVHNVMP